MKYFYFLFLGLSFVTFSVAQNMEPYYAFVEKAEAFYKQGDYQESANQYQAAFDALDGKSIPKDRYEAAKAFAMAGSKGKALYHLIYMAEHPRLKYKELDKLLSESAFDSLDGEEDWTKLKNLVTANKENYERYLDKPLAQKLAKIQELDQKYRLQVEEAAKEFGPRSQEVMRLAGKMAEADAKNLAEIEKILAERGWLGPRIVGEEGTRTLFLVIQHADLETQLKYLPMMRQAVAEEKLQPAQLALLEDRVLMRQGKKQTFGSQIGVDQETGEYYVHPLRDPDKVNEYRASVGLQPLEDYIKIWGMSWDVEKHKERIKAFDSVKTKE